MLSAISARVKVPVTVSPHGLCLFLTMAVTSVFNSYDNDKFFITRLNYLEKLKL